MTYKSKRVTGDLGTGDESRETVDSTDMDELPGAASDGPGATLAIFLILSDCSDPEDVDGNLLFDMSGTSAFSVSSFAKDSSISKASFSARKGYLSFNPFKLSIGNSTI